MKKHIPALLGLCSALLVTSAASAQSPAAPPTRVRGTIENLKGNDLVIKTRSGDTKTVSLTADYKVSGVIPAKLDDVKTGSFVGTAALPQSDGTLKALEVTIFPPGRTPGNVGAFPWDAEPNSSMVNAAVAEASTGPEGQRLTLKYAEGQKTVVVSPNVPVVTFRDGSKDLLKPGAHVFVVARSKADGGLEAGAVSVGENGLVPPM